MKYLGTYYTYICTALYYMYVVRSLGGKMRRARAHTRV